MQVINIPTPVCFNGQHYDGISVHNGVNIGTKPWPCNADRQSFAFDNCATDTTNLWVSNSPNSAEVSDNACPMYLELLPAA